MCHKGVMPMDKVTNAESCLPPLPSVVRISLTWKTTLALLVQTRHGDVLWPGPPSSVNNIDTWTNMSSFHPGLSVSSHGMLEDTDFFEMQGKRCGSISARYPSPNQHSVLPSLGLPAEEGSTREMSACHGQERIGLCTRLIDLCCTTSIRMVPSWLDGP